MVGCFYFLSGIIRRAEVFNLNAVLFFYVFLQSLVFMLWPLLIKDQKDVFLQKIFNFCFYIYVHSWFVICVLCEERADIHLFSIWIAHCPNTIFDKASQSPFNCLVTFDENQLTNMCGPITGVCFVPVIYLSILMPTTTLCSITATFMVSPEIRQSRASNFVLLSQNCFWCNLHFNSSYQCI